MHVPACYLTVCRFPRNVHIGVTNLKLLYMNTRLEIRERADEKWHSAIADAKKHYFDMHWTRLFSPG